MAEINYYKVLQLDPVAEPEIVKAVYWRLSQKYHPDGTQPDPEKMRQINDAHEVIGDPARRSRYDSHRQYGWDPVRDSESARSPGYWNPPQTAYSPSTRAPRKQYRSPHVPGTIRILGSLAIVAFIAVVLQSGFNVFQSVTSAVVPTPTVPSTGLFSTTVDELKDGLTVEGFEFDGGAPGDISYVGANTGLGTHVTIDDTGIYVKAVRLTFARMTDSDQRVLTPRRQALIIGMLRLLRVSDQASEFTTDWIDFWTDYSIEGPVLQIDRIKVELTTDSDEQAISASISPAP